MTKRIVVGVSGASGAPYAIRLIQLLMENEVEVHLCVSDLGKRLLFEESGVKKLNAEDNEALLKSDILPLMRGEMKTLKREINRRKSGVNHSLTQYHWEDLIARIDAALDVES